MFIYSKNMNYSSASDVTWFDQPLPAFEYLSQLLNDKKA